MARIIIKNGIRYLESGRRLSRFVIAALVLVAPALFWFGRKQPPAHADQKTTPGNLVLLASPGRVEGLGETISVGAGADGVIQAVFVNDGQRVEEGTTLAVLSCEDLKAEVDRAKAAAESPRQSRIRLLRGHRDEEREAAAQNTAAAQAVLNQTEEHFKRMETLYQKEQIARDIFEQVKRDYEVAQANYQSFHDQEALVKSETLPEEKSKADAEVMAAEMDIRVATERLRKCTIRAPISGTVLKSMARVGESYSTLVPRPLFNLADDSIRRVRAEVDEWDVGKVKLGQRTIVSADGFPGEQFDGRVVELAHAMGRRTVLSGDPGEKADRDILDVIIELDQPAIELPIGLRVTVQFF
jgi:HlyD family secretion protein